MPVPEPDAPLLPVVFVTAVRPGVSAVSASARVFWAPDLLAFATIAAAGVGFGVADRFGVAAALTGRGVLGVGFGVAFGGVDFGVVAFGVAGFGVTGLGVAGSGVGGGVAFGSTISLGAGGRGSGGDGSSRTVGSGGGSLGESDSGSLWSFSTCSADAPVIASAPPSSQITGDTGFRGHLSAKKSSAIPNTCAAVTMPRLRRKRSTLMEKNGEPSQQGMPINSPKWSLRRPW